MERNTRELTLQEELDMLLSKDGLEKNHKTTSEARVIKQEFVLFSNTGKRPENLENLLNCLMAIRPTSTDVERVFSVCNNYCTKIRTRLSDKSLNSLVFLKFLYGKNKKQ